MKMQALFTENAPAAIGPYSQGYRINNFIFTSGQIPADPVDGSIQVVVGMGRRKSRCAIVEKARQGGVEFLPTIQNWPAQNSTRGNPKFPQRTGAACNRASSLARLNCGSFSVHLQAGVSYHCQLTWMLSRWSIHTRHTCF